MSSKESIVEMGGQQLQRMPDSDAYLIAPVTNLAELQRRLKEFREFVDGYLVEAKDGTTDGDYGTIPGTKKPTLLKPGADKLCEIYGLADDYVILQQIENWESGLFDYVIKCSLTSKRGGFLVSSGLGSCSSFESKYRYRFEGRTCPQCGKETIRKGADQYGGGWYCAAKAGGCGSKFIDGDKRITDQKTGKITNPDLADTKNTILKMARKRSKVDAVLSATRSSGLFSQDLEDMEPGSTVPEHHVAAAPQPAQQAQKPATATTPAAQQQPRQAAPAPVEQAKRGPGRPRAPQPAAKETAPAPAAAAPQAATTPAGTPKAQIPPAVKTNGKPKDLKTWARELSSKVQCSPDQLVIFMKRVLRVDDLKGAPAGQKIVVLNALESIAKMTWSTGMDAVTSFIRNEALTPDFKAVEIAYADLLISASDEPPTA